MHSLPVELYRPILEKVRIKDLCAVARVSRLAQPEAERLLWRKFQAGSADADWDKRSDLKRIIVFCKGIHLSPRRGRYVREMRLCYFGYWDSSTFYDAILRLISLALKRTTGLRILYIDIPTPHRTQNHPSCFGIFTHCSFKLHTLSSHFVWDKWLFEFFENQTSIRFLEVPPYIPSLALPYHLLPNLNAIRVYSPYTLTEIICADRPVTHISLLERSSLDQLYGLPPVGVRVKAVEFYRPARVGGALDAELFVDLELLAGLSHNDQTEQEILSLLQKFKRLYAVELYTRSDAGNVGGILNRCSQACPSLREALIHLESYDSSNRFILVDLCWERSAGTWRQNGSLKGDRGFKFPEDLWEERVLSL